jgi:hypothetical protein
MKDSRLQRKWAQMCRRVVACGWKHAPFYSNDEKRDKNGKPLGRRGVTEKPLNRKELRLFDRLYGYGE